VNAEEPLDARAQFVSGLACALTSVIDVLRVSEIRPQRFAANSS